MDELIDPFDFADGRTTTVEHLIQSIRSISFDGIRETNILSQNKTFPFDHRFQYVKISKQNVFSLSLFLPRIYFSRIYLRITLTCFICSSAQ